MPTTPIVTLRLSTTAADDLSAACRLRGCTRSTIVRLALADYLTQPAPVPHDEEVERYSQHVAVRLDPKLIRYVTEHAGSHNTSLSSVMRYALSCWIDRNVHPASVGV